MVRLVIWEAIGPIMTSLWCGTGNNSYNHGARIAQQNNHGFEDLGSFKNAHELVNLGAHKFSLLNELHNFQYRGKIFCVEFQMELERYDFYTNLKI